MTDTIAAPTGTGPELHARTASAPSTAAGGKSLPARAIGILVSPRSTYADIVEHPKVLGAVLVVTLVMSGLFYAFLSTEVGTTAMVDAQITRGEAMGQQVSDRQIAFMEQYGKYFLPLSILVGVPLVTLVTAGIGIAVFNAVLGGNASFKQVFAVVIHSSFISVAQLLFSLPLNYARETLSSTTSLSVFFPMVDEGTFIGRLLGALDLFRIWWVVCLAVGFGVLYKKKTGPIATSFLIVFFIIVVVVAAVQTALSGA